MNDLKISVTKVMGNCTLNTPLKAGDQFWASDGRIFIPPGGFVCAWALGSLLPLLPAKERDIVESKDQDWMWRVHHTQCPDPDGRVIFKIEPMDKGAAARDFEESRARADINLAGEDEPVPGDLLVMVDEVRGKCTSGMLSGDRLILRGGRLILPPGEGFCLYALQAVLPFLAARQRPMNEGDWLEGAKFICPDPAGNVIMKMAMVP